MQPINPLNGAPAWTVHGPTRRTAEPSAHRDRAALPRRRRTATNVATSTTTDETIDQADERDGIVVRGLTKRYGRRVAVDDAGFVIRPGRVTGFVGPNGAGKSTTMRMMVGLTRPDAGDVRYHGVPYERLARPATVVGAVLDARAVHPGRTAHDHLAAMAALSGIDRRRVAEVLDEVGLATAGRQRVGGFSLGMRQRLALAGALLGEPSVLLLDEPANGLDPDGIRWLRTYLGAFAGRGGTVFVSSHLIAELAMFADDLVVIGGGRVLASGPVSTITASADRTVLVETPEPGRLTELLVGEGITNEHRDGRIAVPDGSRARIAQLALDHHIRLDELSETTTSLEDVLLAMTTSAAEFAAT